MNSEICEICDKPFCEFKTRCGHFFHLKCYEEKVNLKCPVCDSWCFDFKVEKLLNDFKGTSEELKNMTKLEIETIALLSTIDETIPFQAAFEYLKEYYSHTGEVDYNEFLARVFPRAVENKIEEMIEYILNSDADLNVEGNNTALHTICDHGRYDLAERVIKLGFDVNTVNSSGYTPLHLASLDGNFDLVKLLVENGANVNAIAEHSRTPLHACIQSENFEIFKYLLDHGADVNILEDENKSFLHLSCYHGMIKFTQYLIEKKGFDVNEIEEEGGINPLMRSIIRNNLETVKYLVSKGADVNYKSKDGFNPLLYAVKYGSLGTVKFLVGHGADINYVNPNFNINAFFFACVKSKYKCAKYLLSLGSEYDLKDVNGVYPLEIIYLSTDDPEIDDLVLELVDKYKAKGIDMSEMHLLHLSVIAKKTGIVEGLLERGFDVNFLDKYKENALFQVRDIGTLNVLIKFGIDFTGVNLKGRTPLYQVCAISDPETVNKMIQMGLSVKAVDNEGNTLLHAAVHEGNNQVGHELITKYGLDVNAKNFEGKTPLHLIVDRFNEVEIEDDDDKEELNRIACYINTINLLRLYGADLKALDNNGKRFTDYFQDDVQLKILANAIDDLFKVEKDPLTGKYVAKFPGDDVPKVAHVKQKDDTTSCASNCLIQ